MFRSKKNIKKTFKISRAKTRPIKYGRVFLVPWVKCPVYATVHAYNGQFCFYRVPETHGHVKLVNLYSTALYTAKNKS